MRSAVGKAISATPASRLPNLLFGGAAAADPDPALTASGDLPTFYWLLVPSPQGYSVAEHRPAERLERGSVIDLDGTEYRVSVVARSPFLDGRPCAYLEPAT
jgi:hypothetical protein